MSTVYLIDYENVAEHGLKGASSLPSADRIIIFFSYYSNKVNMEALAGVRASLEFIEIDPGPQALDRRLLKHLKHLIEHASKSDDRFVVVSRDRGYAEMLAYWNIRFNLATKCTMQKSIASRPAANAPVLFPGISKDEEESIRRKTRLRYAIALILTEYGVQDDSGHQRIAVGALCARLNKLEDFRLERTAQHKKAQAILETYFRDMVRIETQEDEVWAYEVSYDEKETDDPPLTAEEQNGADQPVVTMEEKLKAYGLPEAAIDSIMKQTDLSEGGHMLFNMIYSALINQFGMLIGCDYYDRVCMIFRPKCAEAEPVEA